MATKIWVNISSGNDLLPDGTKPLPEPLPVNSSDIHLRTILQKMLNISILDMSMKIINLRLQLHLSGVNELSASTRLYWSDLKVWILAIVYHDILRTSSKPGLKHNNRVSWAWWISNHIPQNTLVCYYSSMSQMSACCARHLENFRAFDKPRMDGYGFRLDFSDMRHGVFWCYT